MGELMNNLKILAVAAVAVSSATTARAAFTDNFDTFNASAYTVSGGGVFSDPDDTQAFPTGNALYFGGDGQRSLVVAPLAVGSNASISFKIITGSYNRNYNYFEGQDDLSETVNLSYSNDGIDWISLGQYGPSDIGGITTATDDWTTISLTGIAGGASTSFRFLQISNSGNCCDNWAVDDLSIGGAVPEPATWSLMIGGFGMTGAALRRRRETLITA